MTATRLPADALWRLAERVVRGEVVFFVGAGFSIDNEGNTTGRLLARLLARFEAWTLYLLNAAPDDLGAPAFSEMQRVAFGLRMDLQRTFELEMSADSDAPFLASSNNQAKLNQAYYQLNDWMCTAFEELLRLMSKEAFWRELPVRVNERENRLLESHRVKDRVPFAPIDIEALERLSSFRDRAKALFLETVGFSSSVIMGGDPGAADTETVKTTYEGRLRPRQHVLARLAREGLSPALLTTNFDLLLEGAYRLAGFRMRDPRDRAKLEAQADPYPPVTFQEFQCVSCAPHFFQRGDQRRLVSLLKIHGDVREYRERRDLSSSRTPEAERSWSEYLKSIIFTFREIQNWRDDFWSQDLIRTLLRSRTMAFCGYSAADQVLHDTFRSVYEEMEDTHRLLRGASARPRDAAPQPAGVARSHPSTAPVSSADAPAFFFDLAGVAGFHAAEIMSAASRAIGVETPPRRDHPNRIAFNMKGKFPDLDDCMLWLLHSVIRQRQLHAIQSELGRTVTSLLGEPCLKSTSDQILGGFRELVDAEREQVGQLGPEDHAVFGGVVGWTWDFHVALLREFAVAEQLLRDFRPGKMFQQLRRWPWYYPTADHPEWTAWSAVLELAIRRITAYWRGEPSGWKGDATVAAAGDHPTVVYRGRARPRTPAHLRILLRGFQRAGYPPRPSMPSRWHHEWDLDVSEIPWIANDRAGTPGAASILSWAAGLALSDGQVDQFLEPRGLSGRAE